MFRAAMMIRSRWRRPGELPTPGYSSMATRTGSSARLIAGLAQQALGGRMALMFFQRYFPARPTARFADDELALNFDKRFGIFSVLKQTGYDCGRRLPHFVAGHGHG